MTALRKRSAALVTPVVGRPRCQRVRVADGFEMVPLVQSPAAETMTENGLDEEVEGGWGGLRSEKGASASVILRLYCL